MPPLPSWFKEVGPDALKVLTAAGTGRIIGPIEEAPPAAIELAASCSDKVRQAAADKIAERIYGKVKDVVEVDGTSGALEVLVALARAATPKE
jgi:hypothetical protein